MKQIKIKNPCKVYQMNGNTCSICNTIVHDVENMSNEEIVKLLSGGNKVCISANKKQLKLTWIQIAATFFVSLLVSCGVSKKSPKNTERGTGSYVVRDSGIFKVKNIDTTTHWRGTGSFMKRN